MTLEQAKTLKPGQTVYYRSLFFNVLKSEVKELKYNEGKLEIYFTDDTYIREEDLELIYTTKKECFNSCIQLLKQLQKDLEEESKKESM